MVEQMFYDRCILCTDIHVNDSCSDVWRMLYLMAYDLAGIAGGEWNCECSQIRRRQIHSQNEHIYFRFYFPESTFALQKNSGIRDFTYARRFEHFNKKFIHFLHSAKRVLQCNYSQLKIYSQNNIVAHGTNDFQPFLLPPTQWNTRAWRNMFRIKFIYFIFTRLASSAFWLLWAMSVPAKCRRSHYKTMKRKRRRKLLMDSYYLWWKRIELMVAKMAWSQQIVLNSSMWDDKRHVFVAVHFKYSLSP